MKTHVGFVSTRLAGTDGVSLEAAKWAEVFAAEGHPTFYFAGELESPPDVSLLVPEAHFTHPAVRRVFRQCFGRETRDPSTTEEIHRLKTVLRRRLQEFSQRFDLGLLVLENAVTIPLNIPLGIAITEFISETGMPAIAHHHDFFWERQHFLTNAVWDYLNMSFPPHLPFIRHVVINSAADNQLSLRTGISGTIIPNVMDFDEAAPEPDEYTADVRQALGIADGELFILQPTRVVKRKGIEHAIELIKRLDRKAKLVISHASGDEGHDYEQRVREYSKLMGVDTRFVSNLVKDRRGTTADGRKAYTLFDLYPHADLVTYPSDYEGFGNAFLEAVYFRKPIVVNTYSTYRTDIRPKGFQVIELDGYVTEEALRQTRRVLAEPELRQAMVDHNYELGKLHFSYEVLQQKLRVVIGESLAGRARRSSGARQREPT